MYISYNSGSGWAAGFGLASHGFPAAWPGECKGFVPVFAHVGEEHEVGKVNTLKVFQ